MPLLASVAAALLLAALLKVEAAVVAAFLASPSVMIAEGDLLLGGGSWCRFIRNTFLSPSGISPNNTAASACLGRGTGFLQGHDFAVFALYHMTGRRDDVLLQS